MNKIISNEFFYGYLNARNTHKLMKQVTCYTIVNFIFHFLG